MRKHVQFDVDIPVECTDQEAREWIRFMLHEENIIAGAHQLVGLQLQAENVIIDESW